MGRDAIIAKIDALHVPNPSGIIIVAGAAMAMIGLRTTNDIDLVVDDVNWGYLINLDGWSVQQLGTRIIDNLGVFDVWPGWVDKRTHPYKIINFETIKSDTYIDASGYLVPTISHQILMKQQLRRKKDNVDITSLKRLL